MQGLLCACKVRLLQPICALLRVCCTRRCVYNMTGVTWYDWSGQWGPHASDPKIGTGEYVSGKGHKLIESLTGWWWRLGMRRVDRSAHRTCKPTRNTASHSKCHFRSHSARVSSHRRHETAASAELQKLVAMHIISAQHVKLRWSMHTVNKMQNDQLILRDTTADHASLSLLLLRKRNMHY